MKAKIKINIPLIEVEGNKEDLLEHLRGLSTIVVGKKSALANAPLLEMRCDCGQEFIYTTEKDVPENSVVCECGQEIIKYHSKVVKK